MIEARLMPSRRSFFLSLLLGVLLIHGSLVLAAGKAEGLLRLTPPNASITLAIEDVNAQSKLIRASRLFRSVKAIPAVRGWLNSEPVKNARTSVATVETVLGLDVATIAQSLLGEAVVLSLRIPLEGEADPPQGLLLLKFGDRAVLDKLIDGLNKAQKDSLELSEVRQLTHQGVTYWLRTFQPAGKPPEWYAILGSDTFAWSNSEETIRGVVERWTNRDGKGLSAQPGFREVRGQLPESAIVSLFVDPRHAEKLLNASPPPRKPEEARFLAYVTGYLKALDFVGASLAWKDGPVLHVEEAVDPAKLPPELRAWGDPRAGEGSRRRRRSPSTAFAVTNVSLDFPSLATFLEHVILEDSPERLKNLWTALDGICLGMNAKTEVLARLGPDLAGYLEFPESNAQGSPRWPVVLEIALPGDDSGKLAKALVNGMRTVMAFASLDEKRREEHLRVETKEVDGIAVTFLSPSATFAFGATADRLVLGTSPQAVFRAFSANEQSAGRFEAIRSRFWKGEGSHACVDLHALHAFADPKRAQLAREFASRGRRPEKEVARDLGQLLDLIAPFEAAYITSRIDPGFTKVHRSVGLLGLDDSTP